MSTVKISVPLSYIGSRAPFCQSEMQVTGKPAVFRTKLVHLLVTNCSVSAIYTPSVFAVMRFHISHHRLFLDIILKTPLCKGAGFIYYTVFGVKSKQRL